VVFNAMLKSGAIVGKKYRLCHLVAEGGMAEVYLGEHSLPETKPSQVAIKRLLPTLSADPMFAQMFTHEAKLAMSFHHKNIVACYELVLDDPELFLVMEFISGKEVGSFLPLIKNLSLLKRTQIAVAVGLGVCQALSYLHSQIDDLGRNRGIVHGDISPQNIMITHDGLIKIYDFGAAKTSNSSAIFDDEILQGNIRYMSPEQMRGEKITQESDIFSLSLVLLEIVLGNSDIIDKRCSFKKAHHVHLLKEIGQEYFLSETIKAFFQKGLAVNLSHRFVSGKEALSSLEGIANNLQISAPHRLLKALRPLDLKPAKFNFRKWFFYKPFWSLTFMMVSLVLLVWVIVVIGIDFFEPKHYHSLPYWSDL
jgi:serine/threonine protein kinase